MAVLDDGALALQKKAAAIFGVARPPRPRRAVDQVKAAKSHIAAHDLEVPRAERAVDHYRSPIRTLRAQAADGHVVPRDDHATAAASRVVTGLQIEHVAVAEGFDRLSQGLPSVLGFDLRAAHGRCAAAVEVRRDRACARMRKTRAEIQIAAKGGD